MSICAVIPARGGSKSIPRKNVLPFDGAPLIVHSIRAAQHVGAIERVVVSTDDDEISRIAADHGAEVLVRPAELSDDTASSESALRHALDVLAARDGYEPAIVAFLQATSPLRHPDDLTDAIDTFRREGADSLFTAFRASSFVWHLGDGPAEPLNYDPRRRPRRQDMTAEVVNENGSFYLFKPWVLRETGSRLGGRISVHLMDPFDSFELDEPGDWERLETLARLRRTLGDR